MFPSKKNMKRIYIELVKVGLYIALVVACAIAAEVILFTQYDLNGVIAMLVFQFIFGALAILKFSGIPAIYAEYADDDD